MSAASLKPLPNKKGVRAKRTYGLFTPAAIAEAMEAAKTLPAPTDPKEIKALGYEIRPGWTRAIIDLPIGVAYRARKLSKARGISRGRSYEEIITYYIVSVPEAALDGVPQAYADFNSPEGLDVLTRVMTTAIKRSKALWGGTVGEWAQDDPEDMRRVDYYPNGNGAGVNAPPKPPPPPLSDEERAELSGFDVSDLR